MNNGFRKANIYVNDLLAGILMETDQGYSFSYDDEYIASNGKQISFTLPIRKEPYTSHILFPFFDGLIPEGWLLDIVTKNWKIDTKDRFGLLLVSCKDSIGNVSVEEIIQ